MKHFHGGAVLGALAGLLLFAAGCGDSNGDLDSFSEGTGNEMEKQIRDLYQRAREAGESVPEDVYDWAKADLSRLGDWEYLVVGVEPPGDSTAGERDDEMLQTRLNALGADRWEVFWIDSRGDRLRLFAKRPTRSYLKHIPFSALGRLLPSGGSSGGE